MTRTRLETLEEDFYDGPLTEVNVLRDDEDGSIRIEVKLATWLQQDGWCAFTPSLEEVEAWCAKARKHVQPQPKKDNEP